MAGEGLAETVEEGGWAVVTAEGGCIIRAQGTAQSSLLPEQCSSRERTLQGHPCSPKHSGIPSIYHVTDQESAKNSGLPWRWWWGRGARRR